MEKLNAFFIIGTIGMFTTASFDILLTAFLSPEPVHDVSSLLYPIFLLFLLIGTGVMIKRKTTSS